MSTMRCMQSGWLLAVIMAAAMGTRAYPEALKQSASPLGVSAECESALLEQRWQVVIAACGENDRLTSAPALRAVKGHACLALNRNNESLLLFVSLANEADRSAWLEWAEGFAGRHPASAVACYLKGDALARAKQYAKAGESFTAALELQKDFALALNARGITKTIGGAVDAGKEDMLKACAAQPGLADAHASLGTWELSRNGMDEAEKRYQQARLHAPDFGLAFNGLACVDFCKGPKNWMQASNEFTSACLSAPICLCAMNLDVMGNAAADLRSRAILYFHPSQIKDWQGMVQEIRNEASPIHSYFGTAAIPEKPTRMMMDRFNEILNDPQFYGKRSAQIEERLRAANLSTSATSEVRLLLEKTALVRPKNASELTGVEKSMTRTLNRALLESLYPGKIAKFEEMNPGFTLTTRGGIADSWIYKNTLTTPQLRDGQFRMDNWYKPCANFLEKGPTAPLTGFLGRQWNDHLGLQSRINEKIFDNRHVSVFEAKGGVSTEEIMTAFFKHDEWPVANVYGLAYDAPLGR